MKKKKLRLFFTIIRMIQIISTNNDYYRNTSMDSDYYTNVNLDDCTQADIFYMSANDLAQNSTHDKSDADSSDWDTFLAQVNQEIDWEL